MRSLCTVTQLSTPLLKTFDPTQRYVIAGTPPSGIPGIPTAQQYQASIGTATFDFDASGSRWKQDLLRTYVGGGTARLTTLYLGSYERETLVTQATTGATPVLQKTLHRHQLGTAIYTVEEKPGIAPVIKLDALLTDHLGSTDVILAATWNGTQWSGFQAERQSFDPWGERRNPDTWATQRTQSSDPRVTSGADYHRGFTGHEMLDDFGLIHMNGRIYDPEIGRFLSCDPYVQVPEFSQNFNRYTYVLNNPLTFTDPTGHQINGTWATIIVIVVIIVVTIVTWGSCTAAAGAWGGAILGSTATAAVTASVGAWAVAAIGGAFLGGIAGGLSAKLAGGDFGDVLRGGTIGGLQGGVTAGFLHGLEPAAGAGGFNAQTAIHVAGHGIVGGAANAAMGGKFQDGFISGAVSAAAADLGAYDFIKGSSNLAVAGRTAMAGIVGGTASALGGGKFANGAFTAAFQHLLNEEAAYYSKDVLIKIAQQRCEIQSNATKFDVPAVSVAMAMADEATLRSSREAINDQQDWMAYQDVNSTNNSCSAMQCQADYGPYNINFYTAMKMNVKYALGGGSAQGVARDILDPKMAVKYVAAYMKEVKLNLDPKLTGMSAQDREGEYVNGWRQGYRNRLASYRPGVTPVNGMESYPQRLNELTKILWHH